MTSPVPATFPQVIPLRVMPAPPGRDVDGAERAARAEFLALTTSATPTPPGGRNG